MVGGTKVSLCGEFRDKFGLVKVIFGAEVRIWWDESIFRVRDGSMVGRVKGAGEHKYLGSSGWESGQRELCLGGRFGVQMGVRKIEVVWKSCQGIQGW